MKLFGFKILFNIFNHNKGEYYIIIEKHLGNYTYEDFLKI